MTSTENAANTLCHARVDYPDTLSLLETEMCACPIDEFQKWFKRALEIDSETPNAMTLATVSPQGTPNARIVLLRSFDTQGFVFYTNYTSQKAKELDHCTVATLLFYWSTLSMQVRIEGTVEKVSYETSHAYFQTRPRASQIGAWISPQSQIIENREVLDHAFQAFEDKYTQQPIPCPFFWGGYRVKPTRFEFWKGRPSRLHDRICYAPKEAASHWEIQRLAP
jgi:pyridoxamine 5'-phosphate oxidase